MTTTSNLPFMKISDEDWQAICTRSVRPLSASVYAVKTTGIFCNFGCSAPRPLRDNVVMFKTAGKARAGGFRACKKCRP